MVKPIRILLTGATGTAGSSVLREADADPRVTGILVVGRRRPNFESPKATFLELQDLGDWAPLRGRLGEVDAVIWCVGVSQSSVSRKELARVTHDFTVAGAKAIKAENPHVTFVFLSGQGADPKVKSRLVFAREKGRAENGLDDIGFARWHSVRPAYIHPEIRDHRKPWTEGLMAGLEPLVRLVAPSTVIGSRDLARAMLKVAIEGSDLRILENRDLRRLAGLTRGL